MGNLAYMLKKKGHKVKGSDMNVYPPMSDKLSDWKIPVDIGFEVNENLLEADIVIIGNAVSRGNPQVEATLNSGKEYMSMPQAISHFFLKGKKVIVVAGTHGKTTTTFLIHHILTEAGLKPGLFVGGIRKDGHAGFEIADGDYFVIEGDEYDSAFFDKGSKFLHYRPYYLVLTSLDFDHADIFPDLDAIKVMFRRLVHLVPSHGKIFYWQGSKELQEICEHFQHAPICAYELAKPLSLLEVKRGRAQRKDKHSEIHTRLIGEHNYRNMEVALNVAMEILPSKIDSHISALESFPGVKRRQDILYEDSKRVLIEDFAHHPVAVRETIKAVKEAYRGFKIISLFEPRSATSHRNVFQNEYAECFEGSDEVFITEVFNINKVPRNMRLDVKKITKAIKRNSNIPAHYCEEPTSLLEKLKKILPEYSRSKIVILVMSNGSFGGIYKPILELLQNNHEST